jgi:hypothetical protein
MAKVHFPNEENKKKVKVRLTQEEVINRLLAKHGDRYDYSEVVYVGVHTKIKIGCSVHGFFWQTPKNHINNGQGCRSCHYDSIKGQKLSDEILKKRFVEIHGNTYDYSLVVDRGVGSKVEIICKVHGVFKQLYSSHLNGRGCKKCGILSRVEKQISDTDNFIMKATELHKGAYCYDRVSYKKAQDKVIIFCNKCKNYFTQRGYSHLSGKGCNTCGIIARAIKKTSDTETFIGKARQVHGDKYCYENTKYKGINIELSIYCKSCKRDFQQKPSSHVRGSGCQVCGTATKIEKRTSNTNTFIEKAQRIHNDKYCYKNTEYKKNDIKVSIYCKGCKSDFQQSPDSHLYGQGCNVCVESKGERAIRNHLTGKIEFETEKSFKYDKSVSRLRFDFWVPSFNLCIEYQGVQHYQKIDYFGGEKALLKSKERDRKKSEFCIKNNIKLIIIPYWDFDNIESILKRELKNTKRLTAQLQIF